MPKYCTYAALLVAFISPATTTADGIVSIRARGPRMPWQQGLDLTVDLFDATILDGVYGWQLEEPLTMISTVDGSTVLGTLESLSVSIAPDQSIDLMVAVTAAGDPLSLSVTSADALIFSLRNPQVSLAVDATLVDNDGDGAVLRRAAGPGIAQLFVTPFNGSGNGFLLGRGILHEEIMAGENGAITVRERSPEIGQELLPFSVSQLTSRLEFTLSANDSVSIRSHVAIIPEPQSLILLLSALIPFLKRLR